MGRKGLSATQIKCIAIIAMVSDHIAWQWLEFWNVPSQIMHIFGRIAIPIMCFFIVEGYQHTHDLKRYVMRLGMFAAISVVPYYLFFHSIFGYRQNILVDLLIGLLTLTLIEHKSTKLWLKIVGITVLTLLSITVGGWPVVPTLFILVFYYKDSIRSKILWVGIITVSLVAILTAASLLDSYFGWGIIPYQWYEKFYLLGFIPATLLLYLYNGQRGCTKNQSMFFYFFYPLHFVLLFVLGLFDNDIFAIYLIFHILTIFATLVVGSQVFRAKSSKAQASVLTFMMFTLMFLIGYFLERTTDSLDAMVAAIKLQYVGWCGFVLIYSKFIDDFCKQKMPRLFYIAQIGVVLCCLTAIFGFENNELMYESFGMEYSGGHAIFVMTPGPVFFVVYAYFVSIFAWALFVCIKEHIGAREVEKKRDRLLIIGTIFPWITIVLKLFGLTGGFDIFSFGVLGTLICLSSVLLKYSYFNSVQLAGENAITMGHEGIYVVNTSYRILFANSIMQQYFPDMTEGRNIAEDERLVTLCLDTVVKLEIKDKIFELRREPLIEQGILQGYMIWAIDMTDHYENMDRIKVMAETDMLTGLNNRSRFTQATRRHLQKKHPGAFIMIDMDKFKYVNDHYGHEMGDRVLIAFARVLQANFHEERETELREESSILCRLGGDEFCIFIPKLTKNDRLLEITEKLSKDFQGKLQEGGLAMEPTVSFGIAIANGKEEIDFTSLYRWADEALYKAKNEGRNRSCFYDMNTNMEN